MEKENDQNRIEHLINSILDETLKKGEEYLIKAVDQIFDDTSTWIERHYQEYKEDNKNKLRSKNSSLKKVDEKRVSVRYPNGQVSLMSENSYEQLKQQIKIREQDMDEGIELGSNAVFCAMEVAGCTEEEIAKTKEIYHSRMDITAESKNK